jgi:hypothetical protein
MGAFKAHKKMFREALSLLGDRLTKLSTGRNTIFVIS